MIEYKVVTLRNNDAVDTDDLNALAREGWQVVACAHVSGQGIATILARDIVPAQDWGSSSR